MYTPQQLVKHGYKGTTKEEMIKWFVGIILATRFEFGDRDSLWSTVSQSKYSYNPYFGNTSMNRRRFDMLWRHVWWVHQPDVQGESTSHENYQWKIFEDFFTHFNDYFSQLFSPSGLICADEYISWWNRQDGHRINLGFLIYVTMERKTENGA